MSAPRLMRGSCSQRTRSKRASSGARDARSGRRAGVSSGCVRRPQRTTSRRLVTGALPPAFRAEEHSNACEAECWWQAEGHSALSNSGAAPCMESTSSPPRSSFRGGDFRFVAASIAVRGSESVLEGHVERPRRGQREV
jgi:hypothetical protein